MKYTIVCDWVELLCAGTITALNNLPAQKFFWISDKVKLEVNSKNKNPGFRYCLDIYYGEKKLGLLFYYNSGRYRYTERNTILILLNNEILYEKGFSEKLRETVNDFGIQFLKFTEIHIAIDGKEIVKAHSKLTRSKIYKRMTNIAVSINFNDKEKLDEGFVLGSRKSDKYVAMYWKEKEMKNNYKPYILDFWKENGFPPPEKERIDRVELRLKKADLLTEFSDDFNLLEDADFLANVFKERAGKYLGFKNTNNKKERTIIDWNVFKTLKIIRLKNNTKSITQIGDFTAIKKLILSYKETGDKKYLSSAKSLAISKGIEKQVRTKMPKWLDSG